MANTRADTSARYTYADYLRWPEEERWEVIDGVPYNMTPAPSRVHQGMLVALAGQFYAYLEGNPCKLYVAPFDVRLPKGDEEDEAVGTVVQPDLVVVCDPSKLDDRGCRGAPDLVVEILSPSTAAKDHIQKLALYENHGVLEYWLVHPTDRIAMVYRRGEGGRYGAPEVYSSEQQVRVGIFEDLTLDLRRVFAT
jgi:Uma2 family endonuclease